MNKTQAAGFSILSNTFLIVSKVLVGLFTNSVSIISEAVHSIMDLLAAIIAFFSVKKSAEPADDDHQYGHGKYEDFSGFAEGSLILIAAGYIIYEAVEKLLGGKIDYIDSIAGIVVMGLSVVVNILVSRNLFKVAKKTDSVALFADGEHLRTDIYSSLAVFIGLLCIKFTGNTIYDPIIAIIVAIIIFFAGLRICESSRNNLLDASLSKCENAQIQEVVSEYIGEEVISLKHMRTRKAGMKKNIELVLTVEKNMHISDAHELCDIIENKIEEQLQNTDITIHLEPND